MEKDQQRLIEKMKKSLKTAYWNGFYDGTQWDADEFKPRFEWLDKVAKELCQELNKKRN